MDLEKFSLCTRKCFKYLPDKEPTLAEQACFNRCSFKYTEALKFTSDFINYQNY